MFLVYCIYSIGLKSVSSSVIPNQGAAAHLGCRKEVSWAPPN